MRQICSWVFRLSVESQVLFYQKILSLFGCIGVSFHKVFLCPFHSLICCCLDLAKRNMVNTTCFTKQYDLKKGTDKAAT